MRRIGLTLLAVAMLGGAVYFGQSASSSRADRPEAEVPAAERMVTAAKTLLAGLSVEQRKQASFAFDDPYRLRWHYYPTTPVPRKGAVLLGMTAAEKELVKGLLRSGTSANGYKTALGVISLENILRDIEGTPWAKKYRNSELYYVSVFGTPALTGKWAWRIEGHHLSLNYLIDEGTVVAATPVAFGSNPAEVFAGPFKGLRVLAPEEDVGRRLLTSLDPAARKKAIVAGSGPFDCLTETETQPRKLPVEGLPYGEMTPAARKQLLELIRVHMNRQPPEVADRLLKEAMEEGPENIHFAWMGPPEPGQPHYYRIQGPTFVIEWCNVQNRANHAHTVVRRYKGDF